MAEIEEEPELERDPVPLGDRDCFSLTLELDVRLMLEDALE
jgi:hypothetical protein